MRFSILLIAVLMLRPCQVMGQSEVSVGRSEFKTDKPGFESAWKRVKEGDKYYSLGGVWFNSAVNEYKTAWEYNNRNAELLYKLGASCLFSDFKQQAADYLLEGLSIKPAVADDILLLTGMALQYAGRFDEAVEKLNLWLAAGVKRSPGQIAHAKRHIAECESAKIILKDSIRVEIRNMGANINSPADDYAPVVTRDGRKMYFASRRPLSPDSKNYMLDTKYDENIYRSELESGKWSVSLLAGNNLTTKFCETPVDIDETGNILYIYVGYQGDGDIAVSEFVKKDWRSPEPTSFGINTSKPETSFSISPKGDEIAFVSDRGKKGAGGKDIYLIHRKGKKWSEPVNAGPNINSDYDEESVRFSRGGDTLWFSSAGRNTIGGFDIFFSCRKTDGTWSEAVNAGRPVNTQWNEFFYLPSPADKSLFYFASDRSGGFGGLDIYSGRLIPLTEAKLPVPAETNRAKTDSIPGVMIQKPDTLNVTDTTSVRKKLIN